MRHETFRHRSARIAAITTTALLIMVTSSPRTFPDTATLRALGPRCPLNIILDAPTMAGSTPADAIHQLLSVHFGSNGRVTAKRWLGDPNLYIRNGSATYLLFHGGKPLGVASVAPTDAGYVAALERLCEPGVTTSLGGSAYDPVGTFVESQMHFIVRPRR